MAFKFLIRHVRDKAKKEGDSFIRYSGTGEPFNVESERSSQTVETDPQGNPIKWNFFTGLDEDMVQFYNWFSDAEKEQIKKEITNFKPQIEKFYGGSERLKPTNYSFWKKNHEIGKLKISHQNIDTFYDTEKPQHALLYLSIVGGAFSDIVAPNKDWAERNQIPLYLALELDTLSFGDDDDITKSDAHGELALLRKEFGKDALYILAWCLQYETSAFGAINYNVSERDLVTYHINFIEGRLKSKRQRNFPKMFIDYAEKWRGAQTRKLLYTEAYIKAGEYYNFINSKEKKYVTSDGTVLGNTIPDAVDAIMKPKLNVDFLKLRDSVEAKWKE